MPDPFRRIPAPILLDIVKLLPSLPSLYQFERASGAVSDIFQECSAEIVDAVVRPLPQEIQRVIRAVAIALSDQCPDQVPKLDAPALNMSSALDEISVESTTKDSIPRHLPLASINILLNCACRIYQLAAQFLECHMQRLNSIRPQHLADPEHGMRAQDTLENYPKGRSYTPPLAGPPSWVEEYRVVRALWLIQLYRILETKTKPVNGRESDAADEDHGFSAVWGSGFKDWELDNMECVQDWLNETHLSIHFVSTTIYSSASSSPSLVEADKRSILAHSPTDKHSHAWQQDEAASRHFSMGYRLFHTYGKKSPSSILRNSQWRTFRRLGFGIWDLKRMAVMELLAVPAQVPEPDGTVYRTGFGVPLGMGDVCFTWKSIENSEEHGLSTG